jgi:stearoyl-CoA desaturase (delta-9 desaturase)
MFGLGVLLERVAPELGTSGAQMLVWGFFISTVACYHGTYTINSLSHVFGRQRYRTGDASRNNWLLALITLGEGWHNNHHRYPSSTRNGFYWWEIDPTYYGLKLLACTGFIWGLKPVPQSVLAEGAHADHHASVEAARLAATLHPELSFSSLKKVVPAAAALAVATAAAAQTTLPNNGDAPAIHKDVTALAHELNGHKPPPSLVESNRAPDA